VGPDGNRVVLVVKPHDQAGETAAEDLALLVQPGWQGPVGLVFTVICSIRRCWGIGVPWASRHGSSVARGDRAGMVGVVSGLAGGVLINPPRTGRHVIRS
jgi:hypothetical protein